MIGRIVECTKARVILTLGSEDVYLQWTEKDMNTIRRQLVRNGYTFVPQILPQNNTVVRVNGLDLDSERKNKRLKFTYTKKEVRKAVVTLDSQRISQPAYHEMRMEINPIMPPLTCVKNEKKEMSTTMPYYVVEGVSVRFFMFNI